MTMWISSGKKMKEMKDNDNVNKANPICCSFEHSNSLNFYQTSNAWEVEQNIHNGKNCSIDFEVDQCSETNVVWVCEGRKRSICISPISGLLYNDYDFF